MPTQAVRGPPAEGGPLSDYGAFLSLVYEGRWKPARASALLASRIQAFMTGETGAPYDILVVSMPPQHGKSMTVTEALPAWALCRNPGARVIEISYNATFARLFGRRNRDKLARFGPSLGVSLAKVPRGEAEFETEEGGGMVSRGAFSGVTGHPCDLLLIDDPIRSRRDADSALLRERLWAEWQNSYKTRLSAGAKVVVIQTRWHEDDLAGRILRTEPGVQSLNLPCAAEENDPLGRSPGQALMPEIGKDDRWLAAFRKSYTDTAGARAWNALYQGRPAPAQGNLLHRDWWRYYRGAPPPVRQCVISVDAAFKGGEGSDFVAMEVWGKEEERIYLLDEVHRRMGFPETLAALTALAAKWPRATVLVEDKANGSAVIEVLRRRLPALVAVQPKGGKIARVNAVSPLIEAGNVYLPEDAPYTGAFVEECAAFPHGRHDDRVDAMSQALDRLWPMFARAPAVAPSDPLPFALRTPAPAPAAIVDW